MTIDPTLQLPGGVATFNEVFFDSVIRHQIGLMRLSGSIRNDVFALLDATEADMADKIRSRLLNHRGLNTPSDVLRMQRLIRVLRGTRLTAWNKITDLWVREMQQLAVAEPTFMDGLLKGSVPVVLDTVLPQTSFLKAIVTSKPFEGKTMKQWAKSISRADLSRIEQNIRIGMVQGETGPQIARRIVGTKALRGRNGTTEITRRQAAAITRTAVNGIANHAKRLYYVENKDLFSQELYVATLDSRTTHICMSLDGQKFPIGEGPIPPVHFNCRSLRIAIITPDAVGNRPIREFTQKGLVRDYTRQNGLKVQSNRAKLPRGHKGPFDVFARKRMRQLTGSVPAKTTYQEFLKRQSPEFQNDVLGSTRGKLFREGKLTLDKFVDQKSGKLFPLDRLREMNKGAFLKAKVPVTRSPFKPGKITKLSSKLSAKESNAVDFYKENGFRPINEFLNKRSGALSSNQMSDLYGEATSTQALIKSLDGALAKSTTTSDLVVYRGVSGQDSLLRILKLKKGSIFTERSFSSTSLSKTTAQEFAGDAMFKIRIPRGASAFDVSALGSRVTDLGQAEILLARGARFRLFNAATVHRINGRAFATVELELII